MHKWKQSKGSDATYRNLISAINSAGRKDFAETVHDIASKYCLTMSVSNNVQV